MSDQNTKLLLLRYLLYLLVCMRLTPSVTTLSLHRRFSLLHLAVCAAVIGHDLHRPFLFFLLVLVRLVHSAFEFTYALAQPLGNLRQFLTAEEKEGDEQNQHNFLHP